MINETDIEAFSEQPSLFPDSYERDMWLISASPQDLLKEFIESFEQQSTEADLGATLIEEEYHEWCDAYEEDDHLHELKELTDLVYVAFWYAEKMGWDLMEAMRRVHESNMSKLGVDGKPIRREDGKVLKGPSYEEPNLEDLIE